jgi:hypothetical protein
VITDRSSLHLDIKAVNLEYSAQTCQELLVDDADTILSNWSSRVIENGSTFLSELEVIDYLMATKKSTFGFSESELETKIRLYIRSMKDLSIW